LNIDTKVESPKWDQNGNTRGVPFLSKGCAFINLNPPTVGGKSHDFSFRDRGSDLKYFRDRIDSITSGQAVYRADRHPDLERVAYEQNRAASVTSDRGTNSKYAYHDGITAH
jgi:hypothetical protein